MIKVGLTGNIAAGKSVVQAHLINKGVPVADADIICDMLIRNDQKIIGLIKKAFDWADILDDEKISKKKLASLIYSDIELRKKLEGILHPPVIKEIGHFFDTHKSDRFAVAAVPLLFEAGLEDMFDAIIFVSADEKIRLQRLIERNNISAEFAKQMMDAQMSEDRKIKKCTFVINNNDTLESVLSQTDAIIEFFTNKVMQ